MQYRISEEAESILVEGAEDNAVYAKIDDQSKLIFYGDFPKQKRDEIIEFLQSQCIYFDESGHAYKLNH